MVGDTVSFSQMMSHDSEHIHTQTQQPAKKPPGTKRFLIMQKEVAETREGEF